MPKHTRLQDIDPLAIATRSSILTRIASLFIVCFLVAACGGGAGDNPVANFSILKVFNDGGGVGRGVSNTDGSQVVFITPFITEVVAEASQISPSDISDDQYSDFPITRTTSTANIRAGTFTAEGITANVDVVEDLGGEALVVLFTFPDGEKLVMAGGTAYGSAPSGEFTYRGTQGIGRRVSTTTPEVGTFSLTANFGNQTFSYSGTSTNSAVSGSGTIDTVNGRFATNALNVTADGSDYTGTMHGLLHGSSAQSVSGVFHTNDDNPDYAGAFVGSR